MTTFALADGLLVADTRLTVIRRGVTHLDATNKIRATCLVATTGAGRHPSVAFFTLVPNLLALRWLGVGLYPSLGVRGAEGRDVCMLAVWRTGHVWAFNVDVRRFGPLVWGKVRTFWASHLDDDPQSKGGAGGDTFTLEFLEEVGARAAVDHAVTQGAHTGPEQTVFDTRTWTWLHIPASLRLSTRQRWRRGLQLWRNALTSHPLPPLDTLGP